ncbi:MAG: S-methyl-5-thioribose-1-phosphate isomerase [Alphaproteobacteria bacterium]|nr:S-methyl-5-thioribose-1-phosphate isomerase [Alphaproteobacteria bacterium]
MNVDGTPYRSIWLAEDGQTIEIIDQTQLPYTFAVRALCTVHDAAFAITAMHVRGAPLIGATAAHGVALAMREDASDGNLEAACRLLGETRPTAVNLRWALDDMRGVLSELSPDERSDAACRRAAEICDDDVNINRAIGEHGAEHIVRHWHEKKDGSSAEPVNILTHCNAGWLATVDWGTALSAIYVAHDEGVPVHVWVDETRPRNQGAALTAWELQKHGVPFTLIADNTGGHLMQAGLVDLCITGTDRTTRNGDVANKIGTYLKALAAFDNGVPFYVALPSPTIDWDLSSGRDIPIEQRDATEVTLMKGQAADGSIQTVRIAPEGAPAANYAFDVTPARLVTGFITDRGTCAATEAGLLGLYPERA